MYTEKESVWCCCLEQSRAECRGEVQRTHTTQSHMFPPEQWYFFQLFISILVSVGNGAIFCFGIFSPFMQHEGAFHLNQTQINIVSTCGAVLSYFSLPTGYLFDKYGPKITLLVGAALNLFGWLGMYVIFYDMDNPILGTNTAVISFFFGISQWSASFYETGSVLTNLEAMSMHRGRVIIIQKTFMGLGSSIITQVYVAFFRGQYPISTFFLFLAIFNASLGVLGACCIRMPTPETRVLGLNWKGPTEADSVIPSAAASPKKYNEEGGGSRTTLVTYTAISTGEDEGAAVTSATHAPAENSPITDVMLEAAIRRFDRPLGYGVGLLIVVVGFVGGLTITEAYVSVSGEWRYAIGAITLALLVLFAGMVPLVTPLKLDEVTLPLAAGGEGAHHTNTKKTGGSSDGSARSHSDYDTMALAQQQKRGNNTDSDGGVNDGHASPGISTLPSAGDDDDENVRSHSSSSSSASELVSERDLNNRPLQQNVRTLDMQLMWLVSFAVWGTGTVVSANSTQIYQSLDFLGYTRELDSVYVSIYGVASAVGRIVVGFMEQALMRRHRSVARLFPIAPLINVLGIPLFFILPAKGLIVAFFLCGLATGVTWGSTVLIIKSLFAPNNCGKHYNVLYTAGMLTPLLMNVAMFGPLFDRESDAQQRQSTHTCSGAACVDIPLLTSLVMNVIAVPCAVIFTKRIIRNRGLSMS